MTDAAFGLPLALVPEDTAPPPPKASWPLMGDILAHRAGVPEHLIQWARAKGEPDPAPLP